MGSVLKSDGKWPKGQSGNPNGRPKGKKNQLTELQQELELAVRQSLKPQDVLDVVQKMVELAKTGDTKAAKLILDKVVPNAAPAPDEVADRPTFVFRIENATVQQVPPAIDVDVTEIKE